MASVAVFNLGTQSEHSPHIHMTLHVHVFQDADFFTENSSTVRFCIIRTSFGLCAALFL